MKTRSLKSGLSESFGSIWPILLSAPYIFPIHLFIYLLFLFLFCLSQNCELPLVSLPPTLLPFRYIPGESKAPFLSLGPITPWWPWLVLPNSLLALYNRADCRTVSPFLSSIHTYSPERGEQAGVRSITQECGSCGFCRPLVVVLTSFPLRRRAGSSLLSQPHSNHKQSIPHSPHIST